MILFWIKPNSCLAVETPLPGIFPDSVPNSELFFPCLTQGTTIKGSQDSPTGWLHSGGMLHFWKSWGLGG